MQIKHNRISNYCNDFVLCAMKWRRKCAMLACHVQAWKRNCLMIMSSREDFYKRRFEGKTTRDTICGVKTKAARFCCWRPCDGYLIYCSLMPHPQLFIFVIIHEYLLRKCPWPTNIALVVHMAYFQCDHSFTRVFSKRVAYTLWNSVTFLRPFRGCWRMSILIEFSPGSPSMSC